MCIGLLRPARTPKVKYSLSKLLLWLALSARIQWPFRTSTPSQREIFSLTAVIVACSLCSYTVAFQDQHTLPKRNSLFSQSCYCGLLIWSFLSGPAHPLKEKYSLKAVIVACSVYLHFRTSTPSQSEIFYVIVACSLCSCVLAFLRPTHTPKVKYSLSKLLLWLALSARIQWPFRTSTASQSEIF